MTTDNVRPDGARVNPHDAYSRLPGVNWSSLKLMATSPLLYHYRLDHPEPDKPAWALGRAIHMALLEPERYCDHYTIWSGTRRGKAWTEFRDHAEAAGMEILTDAERATVEACRDAVLAHPMAPRYLEGQHEVTVQWTDSGTGIDCKARLDVVLGTGQVVDLKTTRHTPDPRGFARDAATYLYHGQMAFYHDGAIAAGLVAPDAVPPAIIAVQTEPPHDVAVLELDYGALEAGRALYRRLLDSLDACRRADYWPGVAPGVVPLRLPRWAIRAALYGEEPAEEEWG